MFFYILIIGAKKQENKRRRRKERKGKKAQRRRRRYLSLMFILFHLSSFLVVVGRYSAFFVIDIIDIYAYLFTYTTLYRHFNLI